MVTPLTDSVEQILMKLKNGEMTAEEAQAAIQRLIDQAGADSPQTVKDWPGEQRIKSAAQKARSMAS